MMQCRTRWSTENYIYIYIYIDTHSKLGQGECKLWKWTSVIDYHKREGKKNLNRTEMPEQTIMIWDSDGGPYPIRASVKPKSPKHAPAPDVMSITMRTY